MFAASSEPRRNVVRTAARALPDRGDLDTDAIVHAQRRVGNLVAKGMGSISLLNKILSHVARIHHKQQPPAYCRQDRGCSGENSDRSHFTSVQEVGKTEKVDRQA